MYVTLDNSKIEHCNIHFIYVLVTNVKHLSRRYCVELKQLFPKNVD